MVSVALQLWAGETQLIFSSHEDFLEHTLNLCLQQIKAIVLIHSYHPLWKFDSKKHIYTDPTTEQHVSAGEWSISLKCFIWNDIMHNIQNYALDLKKRQLTSWI